MDAGVCHEWVANGGVESEGVGVDAVVDGEFVCGAGNSRTAATFVCHHVFPIREVCDGRHTGAICVRRIRNIINRRLPRQQIRRHLMDELLSVQRIPLVGVVANDFAFVIHQEWFPDSWDSIVWYSGPARCNAADEVPGVAFIFAGVDVDLCVVEIRWD